MSHPTFADEINEKIAAHRRQLQVSAARNLSTWGYIKAQIDTLEWVQERLGLRPDAGPAGACDETMYACMQASGHDGPCDHD